MTAQPRVTRSASHQPPLVKGLPFIGNGWDLFTNPNGFLNKCYRELGPVFRVRIPGQEITIIAGQEANLLFHHSGDSYFRTRPVYNNLVEETESENYLIAIDGDEHSYQRRAMRPGVAREAFAPFIPSAAALIQDKAEQWQAQQLISVMDVMQGLVLEQISGSLANSPVADHINTIVQYTFRFIGSGVAFQPKFLLRSPFYQRNKRRFELYLKAVVEQHRAHKPNGTRSPDLIDLLINNTYRDGTPFKEADLLSYAHVPYVNGLAYPSRVCGFLLYSILKEPGLLEKVQAEIDSAFADGIPDSTTLRRMKSLRGAYMETLRMYPVTTAIPRAVAKSFEYGGYKIEEGLFVFIGTTMTHFLPEFYPDPYTFDIERYSEPRNEHRQPGTFAPFGFGNHACLSIGLVETLCMITIASLLHTVKLELTSPDYEIRTVIAPVPGPEAAFKVRVVEQRSIPKAAPKVNDEGEDPLSVVLDALNTDQLRNIAPNVKGETYPPGTVIVCEGDVADAFYILIEGDVTVEKQIPGKPSQIVAELKAGDHFGEIGLLYGGVRTATVRAVDTVQTWVLDRETFLKIVNESDLTSSEISRFVQRRMISNHLAVALPNLSREQVAQLATQGTIHQVAPNTTIIHQGEPAELFYIIIRGRVEVINHHPTCGDIILGSLGAGDYFGEAGIMQGAPRTATVRTPTDSEAEVFAFDRSVFRSMVIESEATSEQIARKMSQRLIELAQRGGKLE